MSDIRSRFNPNRKRAGAKTAPVTNTVSTPSQYRDSKGRLNVIRWFNTIRNDRGRLNDAYEYFEEVLKDGQNDTGCVGRLEDLCLETPGLVGYYRGFLTDAQQIRRWLEEHKEVVRGKKYQWLMTSQVAKQQYGDIKTTEATNYSKIDVEVIELGDMVRIMARIEHALEDITEAIQNRSIMLTQVVAIRKSGLEEVWVDPRKETVNE